MKVVLLAGGLGSRLAEETHIRPKPMVEIGGVPIIEHIMNWYMKFNYKEFIICLGYKGDEIISYFKDYHLKGSSVVISENGKIETINGYKKPWKISLVQTGENTQTAGRINRIRDYLKPNETFFMTYGDGLSDININKLLENHKKNKKLATVTAVRPLARFGALDIKDSNVESFTEKPINEVGWINGGFFVLSERALNFINNDNEPWEIGPLNRLVKENQLAAYKHHGFWQPMDTLREKQFLCNLWENGKAPWNTNSKENKNIINFFNKKVS